MFRLFFVSLLWAVATFAPSSSFAQVVNISGYTIVAHSQDRISDKHLLLVGGVELRRDEDGTELYADQVEFFEDEDRALATGNVVLIQGNNRIAAERAEFNTKSGLGTFFHASGIATLQPNRQRAAPGISGSAVPSSSGSQPTDIYFFGDTVEKLAAKKYKITNGGFSACVQPTPRWDLSADTITLNIDHYTLLTQVLLRVKNVPMLYIPAIYYPTKEDGRATGFLLPTYANSAARGHTIHNAFFWAIDRSMDATILHDWSSQTGQGAGAEYRINRGSGGDGEIRFYGLNQGDVFATDGTTVIQPGTRSYNVDGFANRTLPGNFRARARVNYFSSLVANQTFSTNVNVINNNNSSYGANVVGAWRSYSVNATYDRNQYYYPGVNTSSVSGTSPQISITRTDRPLIPNSRLYFRLSGDAAHFDRQTFINDTVAPTDDRSLGRFDFSPQVRYPFTRWQWFTVNTSLDWHETFYTRSLTSPFAVDPVTGAVVAVPQVPIDEPLNRQYFTLNASAIGPVFTRIWDTPNSRYAVRIKHTIEPMVNVSRVTAIANFDRILKTGGTDYQVGETTGVTYALTNRIYAKRKTGQFTAAQEILNVVVLQTYNTNAVATQFDPRYNTSFATTTTSTTTESHYSPIQIRARAMPVTYVSADFQAEIDSHYRQLRSMSLSGYHSWNPHGTTSVGWTRRFFIEGLPGFDQPSALGHNVTFSTNMHTADNKYGVSYSLYYDVLNSLMNQQRIATFYNAQCCGAALEYQRVNFPPGVSFGGLQSDQRFFLSVTLAGLGNFSPFNGGLMGVTR